MATIYQLKPPHRNWTVSTDVSRSARSYLMESSESWLVTNLSQTVFLSTLEDLDVALSTYVDQDLKPSDENVPKFAEKVYPATYRERTGARPDGVGLELYTPYSEIPDLEIVHTTQRERYETLYSVCGLLHPTYIEDDRFFIRNGNTTAMRAGQSAVGSLLFEAPLQTQALLANETSNLRAGITFNFKGYVSWLGTLLGPGQPGVTLTHTGLRIEPEILRHSLRFYQALRFLDVPTLTALLPLDTYETDDVLYSDAFLLASLAHPHSFGITLTSAYLHSVTFVLPAKLDPFTPSNITGPWQTSHGRLLYYRTLQNDRNHVFTQVREATVVENPVFDSVVAKFAPTVFEPEYRLPRYYRPFHEKTARSDVQSPVQP